MEITDAQSVIVFQNDFRVAYKLPWRLTEVPFLKFHFVAGGWIFIWQTGLILRSLALNLTHRWWTFWDMTKMFDMGSLYRVSAPSITGVDLVCSGKKRPPCINLEHQPSDFIGLSVLVCHVLLYTPIVNSVVNICYNHLFPWQWDWVGGLYLVCLLCVMARGTKDFLESTQQEWFITLNDNNYILPVFIVVLLTIS